MSVLRCALLSLPLVMAGVPAAGLTLDFEGLAHGEIVDSDFAGVGVTITATNPNRSFDLAVAFDTNQTGTADPDLEGPPTTSWAGGNLAPGTVLNTILVLQENGTGCSAGQVSGSAADICDDPDDDVRGGSLRLDFATSMTGLGLDLVDVNDSGGGHLNFLVGNVSVGKIDFSDFTSAASPWFDPSVSFGNHFANRISPITATMLNQVFGNVPLSGFDSLIVSFEDSGGIDNVTFAPEPGSFALLAGGLLALAGAARRLAARP